MSSSTQHTAGSANTNANGARLVLALVLGAWFLIAVLMGTAGWLVAPAGQPPLVFLVAVLLPIIVYAGAYGASERVREYVRAGDPVLLTNLQSWRVLGGIFLVLLMLNLLPASFAEPAGWGDVAIGATAPFVAAALAARGAHRTGKWFIGWQLLGVLDLVTAIGTGSSVRLTDAAGAEQMLLLNRLPLSLIPTFAVPLFVMMHHASIVQVRAAMARKEEPARVVLGEVG